ncbi:MBL fold metallo-hydrolase [Bradyrhizobium sp. sBnM-33]|uniref:MBL fold metallo-hydrolase n=2 Tax=Bradyrhizobium sp. sBnM-33 TaxID=2831780 RepID=UPI00390C6885
MYAPGECVGREYGDRLVLIDAGSRGKMQQQPTAGRLLQNLAAAEIKPEEVDTILITHAHPDHLWGWLTQVTPSGPFQTPNL